MKYISTRGGAPALDFAEVTLAGLAADGGLYVPSYWPRLTRDDLAAMQGLSYQEVARRVMRPFVGEAIEAGVFDKLVDEAYAEFDHAAVAPVRHVRGGEWLLELFHGPTLAFKDIALQLLGRLIEHLLAVRSGRATIVGATSGDTGSAAIAACRDRAGMAIFMLHPAGRVSEVQRRQMTTVASPNVHNLAIEGTFDDCQALVKAMFNDAAFRDQQRLSAVNSINWARVMAQAVYYVFASVALGTPAREVMFAVPTGNFGDVYAGYVAERMGLPVRRLVVATNRNDILDRFFRDGSYRVSDVTPTISPSMDIQVASNFERLLFDLCDRDGAQVTRYMGELRCHGAFAVDAAELKRASKWFASGHADEEETMATIASLWEESGLLIDPHTAVGIHVGRATPRPLGLPLVMLATAHPAKFPDAVEKACGVRPELPARLADLFELEERYEVLPNDLDAVQAFIRARA